MELALPITVYWDLALNPPLDETLLRICDEILEFHPLMLQLYDPSPVLSNGVRLILERFRGTPVAVSLTVPYVCIVSLAGTSTAELGVRELLLACDNLESLDPLPLIPVFGLSFYVTRTNWHTLPDVVSFCRERGVNRLVLPLQRLYKGESPFLLDRSEQGRLERSLATVGGADGLRLTIHDPFLWRAFNPGTPFPQGGCQAANTMIAISPDGGVFPCPSLPERIGAIGEMPLKEILISPAKKELRNRVVRYPAACDSCQEINICRGGCRGRSLVMHGSLEDIDDACR
ncbi:MAG: GeoRSP system SPASM domain protein [Geobacteraceae bacterium]|nr:GeoRSP system SPASM domain protein [Geobacteraceae bacterium]